MIRSIVTYVLAVSIALATTGCHEVIFKDRIVKVPVLVFQQPPEPAKIEPIGDLPTDQLTPSSSDEETARAYAETLEILKSYVKQLEAALAPFRKSDVSTTIPK